MPLPPSPSTSPASTTAPRRYLSVNPPLPSGDLVREVELTNGGWKERWSPGASACPGGSTVSPDRSLWTARVLTDEADGGNKGVQASVDRIVTSPELDAIDLYWRPGCGFCMNLDRQLKNTDLPIRRHNIWDDEDAAAVVRSHARGNETVPTVVIGDQAMVNPSARQVLTAVAESAPHLLPDDFEIPQPRLTRLFGRSTS